MLHSMSRFLKISPLLAIGYSLVPVLVSAAAPSDVVKPIVNQALDVSRILITLMMVLSVVVLGWGIVRLILAAGNPDAVKKAKGVIIWGIIGIAVFVSLFALIEFIQSYFGVTEEGVIKPPTIQ